MSILETAQRRYSCKHFDPSRKISEQDLFALKEILRLCPSSINIQPWHFLLTGTEEGKKRVTAGTQGFFKFNAQKLLDCSHVLVMCRKTDLNQHHINKLIAKEEKDGRYTTPQLLERATQVRASFFGEHMKDPADLKAWATHQIYINLGNILLAAADMGIDTLPIEGFDPKALSEAMGLAEQNLEPVLLVALGYSTEDDFNKHLPKSRFEMAEIFTEF